MKIISLNSSDTFGGAARAAYRLQGELRRQGVDARMLVQRKLSDDPAVIGPEGAWGRGMGLARNILDRLPLLWYRGRSDAPFYPGLWPSGTVSQLNRLGPDLVHLHWVCEGQAGISSLARIQAPVLWTLHDSWAFTGGCHVPFDCMAFEKGCGCCPQLGSNSPGDLSHLVWSAKRRMLSSLKPVLVTPSRWLAERARQSSLARELRIEVIPNGLDLTRYQPVEKAAAKQLLGLDQKRKLLLFCAIDGPRHHHKGFHLLKEALQACASQPGFVDNHQLYVIGCSAPEEAPELPIPVRYGGRLQDDLSLSVAYSAADLYLAPALQENFSSTVLESLACGTPCVVFDAGGMPDLIEHGKNGYLAPAYDSGEFARGLIWCLADGWRHTALCLEARSRVEARFGLELMAQRYRRLYEELCGSR